MEAISVKIISCKSPDLSVHSHLYHFVAFSSFPGGSTVLVFQHATLIFVFVTPAFIRAFSRSFKLLRLVYDSLIGGNGE